MTSETKQHECCTCACHEAEENHSPENCYCMRIKGIPKCQKCGQDLDFETPLCEDCSN